MTEIDWRRLPSLSSLRAFEATARLGGFSAASRALNVTPAAVAQQVRALEADLGLSLARREGRGLSLTAEGHRLAGVLHEAFSLLAEGVEETRTSERDRGLRISATPAFTQSLLMPLLEDFWASHPEIAISLTPDFLTHDLEREGYDIAIRSGDGDWPGLQVEHLVEAKFTLVGAPRLLARNKDLRRLPWIGPLSQNDRAFLERAGIDPDALTIHGLDSPTLAVLAAQQGYGLLVAADIIVRRDIAAGRLVEIPMVEMPGFSYWAVTLPGQTRPAARAFVDWLKQAITRD